MIPLWLLKNWKWVAPAAVAGVLAVLLGVQTVRVSSLSNRLDSCVASRKLDRETYEKAQAQAQVENLKTVQATEKKWREAAIETKKTYDEKLSVARDSLAAYASRMRSTATASPTGTTSLSNPVAPSSRIDGTSPDTFLPVSLSDLDICTENTVKAESWQHFWKGVVDGQPEK